AKSRLAERVAKRAMGIDRRRALPKVAPKGDRRYMRPATFGDGQGRRKVALFVDTYAASFHPGTTATQALSLLLACGFEVELIRPGCCQRPAMSKGLLHRAKRHGEKTMRRLLPSAEAGVPILFLEPSCASAIADDLPDLIDDVELGRTVAKQCFLLEDFLADEQNAGRLDGRFVAYPHTQKMLVHGHCHQKALFARSGLRRILSSIEGIEFSEVDSGCCGMAGSFGYEHHALSMRIGEQRLFPAVREAEQRGAVVCATGFSCRHQIRDGCGVEAKHWVELIGFEPTRQSD
ncbi:MAG: (Fe-S)-binding protein, partial [Phycisphaeraceae bacterium]